MNEILSQPFVAIIFLLGLLVFVHEFGHFIVGKIFGIGVETFSIGFGPKLLGFRHKNTEYRLSWLPLGGFVKFAGAIPAEEVAEEFKGKEFYNASFLAQSLTVLAGPLANLFLAIVVYCVLGMQGIEHPAPIIGQIRQGSPAEKSGLRSGDIVTYVNSKKIISWNDLQESIASSPNEKIDIDIVRKSSLIHLQITPEPIMQEDMAGRNLKQGRIGIGYGFLPAIVELLPESSPSRESGVLSGWNVKTVYIADKDFKIETWDDFIESLNFAYDNKAPKIRIQFENASKALEEKTLSTEVWWKSSKPRQLSSLLGLTDSQFTVQKVEEPADVVLKEGDRILSVENQKLQDIYALSDFLQKNEKESLLFSIQRGSEILSLNVKLKPIEIQKASGKSTYYLLPLTFRGALVPPPPVVEIYTDLLSDIQFAVRTTVHQSYSILDMIGGLFAGEVPLKVLGGPILIAKVAGDSVKLGVKTFLTSLALISINLGIMNLFPIPALDGGKLFMIVTEGVLRRRLNPEFVENYHKIGFVMLLALVVLATYNDLSRFWSSILQGLIGTFK